MSNLRLPQGSGAGGDAGGHNELEEVPNIYQLLNQHPLELWKIFVAINISYNVAETNNSKDKYKYKSIHEDGSQGWMCNGVWQHRRANLLKNLDDPCKL